MTLGLSIFATNATGGPRDLLVQTQLDLQNVLSTASFEEEKDIQRLEKADDRLAESLNLDFWADGSGNVPEDDGKKIFYAVRKAAKELEKTEGRVPEVAGLPDAMFVATCTISRDEIMYRLGSTMVDLDQQTVADLIEDGQGKELEKALEKYLSALEDRAQNEIPDAIKACKDAFKHALKAPEPVVSSCEALGTC
jgi:uncharacterized protein YlaN (UPF0358 family)